ncbi:MAG: AraC family transcriptional regulator [Candidatus Acidiferrum sp.]
MFVATSMTHEEIQGNVVRRETLGQLRLTESVYQPGLSIGVHCHSSAIFGLILRGYLQQQSSLVTMNCCSGSVFYNPPEIPHTNLVNDLGARCVYLELSPQWLERVDLSGSPLKDPALCPNSRIRSLTRRIYTEWLGKDDLMSLMLEGLSCELVAELFRAKKESTGRRPPVWLTRVRDLIECRFADPPSLSELSVEAGFHRVHVARQFRRHYGMTIGEFVRHRRVEFARDKLCNSNLSIVDIALEAGFAHQAHFTTVFRKLTGMTPRQYCAEMGAARRMKARSELGFPSSD